MTAQFEKHKTTTLRVHTNTNSHKIERVLQAHPCGLVVDEIVPKLPALSRKAILVGLKHLVSKNRAHHARMKKQTYRYFHGPAPLEHQANTRYVPEGIYKPHQWAHEIARPQSQDHARHGSLQADGSVKPYRPPVHGCVGLLADRRSNSNN
jgi:hypothetical protein